MNKQLLTRLSKQPFLIDNVDMSNYNQDEIDNTVKILMHTIYVVNPKTPKELKGSWELCLNSIKKSIDSVKYVDINLIFSNEKIYFYLVSVGYSFNVEEVLSQKLSLLINNTRIFKDFLKRQIPSSDEVYKNALIELVFDLLNFIPNVATLNEIFDVVLEEEWEEHKAYYRSEYVNVFGKITNILKNYTDFDEALSRIDFLDKIKLSLSKRQYSEMLKALKKYQELFHSKSQSNQSELLKYSNLLLSFVSLYIAKSKENYKKDMSIELSEWAKIFFKPNYANPDINNRFLRIKKVEEFRNLFLGNDLETLDKVNRIRYKYEGLFSKKNMSSLINSYIIGNISGCRILKEPIGYKEYKEYLQISKLVNRLNSGYIDYSHPKVRKIKDKIKLDEKTNQFVYCGRKFSESDLLNFQSYEKTQTDANTVIKDINELIENTELKQISAFEERIKKSYELSSKYFVFDIRKCSNLLTVRNFYSVINMFLNFSKDNFKEPNRVYDIRNILSQNAIIWITMLIQYEMCDPIEDFAVNYDIIAGVTENISKMQVLSKCLNISLNKFKNVIKFLIFSEYSNEKNLAILGTDIAEKLYKSIEYTVLDTDVIFKNAEELVCGFRKKKFSTVPFVNGNTGCFNYSLYTPDDNTFLTAGIDTNACFKVGGEGNDFFHYCILSKNGIIIKITDKNGELVARSSGFRSGNSIYFNQLNTIYDDNFSMCLCSIDERKEIVDAFKVACADLIKKSQENDMETIKIENIFVTESLILDDVESNVPAAVQHKIGEFPINVDTDDWASFAVNPNLLEVGNQNSFYTNLDNYLLICISSIKDPETLTPLDIIFTDVEPVYEIPRLRVNYYDIINSDILKRLKNIKGVNIGNCRMNFEYMRMPGKYHAVIGNNWFIVYDDTEIKEISTPVDDIKSLIECRNVILHLVSEKSLNCSFTI